MTLISVDEATASRMGLKRENDDPVPVKCPFCASSEITRRGKTWSCSECDRQWRY